MQMPPGIDFKKIERKDKYERNIPITCSPPRLANNNTLICDIGNPLPQSKYVSPLNNICYQYIKLYDLIIYIGTF